MLFHRWPVYAPPLFFWWWYAFDAYAPNVFARGAWIAGSGGVLAFLHERDRPSTAMSFLGLYRDPVVAHVTRRCDWRIRDLVAGPHPATLYLVVPPSDISRTKPLVRLVLNQIGRRLTEELEAKRRHRLLLMLDEFQALGRLFSSGSG